MCLKTKVPSAPAVQEAPRRDQQGAAVADARRRVSQQPSVYGNIFTSALGDTGYGRNVAALGA